MRPQDPLPEENSQKLAQTLRLFFRFTSPRILAVTAICAWALRLVERGWSFWDLALAAGILAFWPLQEWLIHVYILHFRPRTVFGWAVDFMNAREHRKHHRDPWNLPLVFVPTPVFFYTIPVLWIGWHLLMPTPALAATGVAVYLTLALHYEWAHYLAHSRYVPRSNHYRRVVRHHRLHHFKNERYWYGVSMISGDRLLGTAPDPRSVPTSDTVRSLGLELEAV
jgi:hypothetical protein